MCRLANSQGSMWTQTAALLQSKAVAPRHECHDASCDGLLAFASEPLESVARSIGRNIVVTDGTVCQL